MMKTKICAVLSMIISPVLLVMSVGRPPIYLCHYYIRVSRIAVQGIEVDALHAFAAEDLHHIH